MPFKVIVNDNGWATKKSLPTPGVTINKRGQIFLNYKATQFFYSAKKATLMLDLSTNRVAILPAEIANTEAYDIGRSQKSKYQCSISGKKLLNTMGLRAPLVKSVSFPATWNRKMLTFKIEGLEKRED